ncbi:MAG: helix-turn-helix domain-containing protein [Acidobacteria bacterium]|nr:helix-turn-helix domain-containing protein [Acidobacteriota bacterium]
MRNYYEAAMEKAMTRQEIILRAYAKKISWIEAAEILGMSCRHLRRIRERYEAMGYEGLFDGQGERRVRDGYPWRRWRRY